MLACSSKHYLPIYSLTELLVYYGQQHRLRTPVAIVFYISPPSSSILVCVRLQCPLLEYTTVLLAFFTAYISTCHHTKSTDETSLLAMAQFH